MTYISDKTNSDSALAPQTKDVTPRKLALSHTLLRKPCEHNRIQAELAKSLKILTRENQCFSFLTLTTAKGKASQTLGYQIFGQDGTQLSVFLPRSNSIAKGKTHHSFIQPLIRTLRSENHQVLELKGNKPSKHLLLIAKHLGISQTRNVRTDLLKERAARAFKN